ncbi:MULTISPECIES: ABC transporter permease [Bacillus]|uniref:ABC transporter permease n=1 Tax=Bacillus TaxID=1386 RepID=UPI00031A952B|nr:MULTISPECIES: ABC transporter permease subunit [Bacillus]
MKIFSVLLQKELVGIWRSKKLIYVPIVFMLYMVMQPITNYYMEDILKMGGGLPDGAIFSMPELTSGEVMGAVLSQLNTMGVLLIIITVMGAINDERKNGSLSLLLVRPVSLFSLIASKLVSNSLLLVFSFICGYLLSLYYTIILYDVVSWNLVLASLLLYCLYIIFIVSCVVCTSALLTSNGAIAIVNVFVLGVLSIGSGWFVDALKYSPTHLSSYAVSIVSGERNIEGLWGCVIVTIIVMLLLHFVSAMAVKKINN